MKAGRYYSGWLLELVVVGGKRDGKEMVVEMCCCLYGFELGLFLEGVIG